MNAIEKFMCQKGQEYRTIDKNRAKKIYENLKPNLTLPKNVIQILGTNGKGSTGRFISLLLMQNGFKILHFTSPHIFRFKERFYKNGKIISDKELLKAHCFLQSFDFMKDCSYFEYATFLAVTLSQNVDYLILEAGVGGELDSTSVIRRNLCVFSVIDFDHEDILGNSIKEIATTKLNAVFYPNKAQAMLLGIQKHKIVESLAKHIAKSHKIDFYRLKSDDSSDVKDYILKHHLAPFLSENLALALKTMEILGLSYNLKTLKKLDLMGRFQKIASNITIDVGHNQNAALAIKQNLATKKVILVYNSYFQKNIGEILGILKDNILRVEILAVDNPRIIAQKRLENILESLNIAYQNFKGVDSMEREKNYLVFGSFSVVEAFMRDFIKQNGAIKK